MELEYTSPDSLMRVWKLRFEGDTDDRYVASFQPTTTILLHDPVNDVVAILPAPDCTSMATSLQLPEVPMENLETGYDTVHRYCKELGFNPKSVTYVQNVSCDPVNTTKRTTVMYVTVDSRTLPEGVFSETTGTELIKQMGTQEAIPSGNFIATMYLKIARKKP